MILGARLALRVSEEEKELWVEAAGGSQRLSEWVRGRLNASLTERDQSREGSNGTLDSAVAAVPQGGGSTESLSSPAFSAPRSVSDGFGMRNKDVTPDPKRKP